MRTTTFALAILSLWRACSAQTETLVPITAADIGLQRRDGNTVTLQNQVQLLWGGTNSKCVQLKLLSWLTIIESYFANMTLQSGDNELVLSTEYFGTVLSNLTCTSKLSLTFNSNTTFQAAIADWQWVNFSENRTFIMIVNYPGCTQNTDNGRQPWIVSNVRDYDEINLTVDFEATLSTWAIVAHDFILDFGSSTPTPSAIAARDNSYYVDPNSMSRVSPRWNKDESISLNLQHELPSTLYSQTLYGLDFSILCPGCETTGEIKLDGHLEYTLFGPKVISLTATPKDVGINLTALGFQVSGTLGSGWGDSVFVVPDVGLPGWSIPGIFDFGPQFSVEVGFQLSGVKGSATIEAGFTANIPDSSTAVLGIKGVDSSSSGWVPNVVTQPPSLNIEVDGSLELYARTSLDLGATILSVYSFGAGIFMKLPDVILTLGAEYGKQFPTHLSIILKLSLMEHAPDSAGVCDTSDVFAVNFGATVGVDLELGVYTQAGGAKVSNIGKPIS